MSIPKTESDFRALQDTFFIKTKKSLEIGEKPIFKNLLEIMKSESVIVSAIHKIKGNKGSKTPGSDGLVIEQIIVRDYREVIQGSVKVCIIQSYQKVWCKMASCKQIRQPKRNP